MGELSIKTRSVNYHRNGVCGIGFYVLEWVDPEHGNMIGTVFNHRSGKDVWQVPLDELHYSVITPMDIEQGWRGDHYIYAMVGAIKEYTDKLRNGK